MSATESQYDLFALLPVTVSLFSDAIKLQPAVLSLLKQVGRILAGKCDPAAHELTPCTQAFLQLRPDQACICFVPGIVASLTVAGIAALLQCRDI